MSIPKSVLPPDFDFLSCTENRGDAAGVYLQQVHLACRVRGEEGRACGLSSLHVPAAQAEVETLCVV